MLEKRAYSCFHETDLDPLMRGLGVDTVVICGLHTDTCDRHTAADAFFRGYRVRGRFDAQCPVRDRATAISIVYPLGVAANRPP